MMFPHSAHGSLDIKGILDRGEKFIKLTSGKSGDDNKERHSDFSVVSGQHKIGN